MRTAIAGVMTSAADGTRAAGAAAETFVTEVGHRGSTAGRGRSVPGCECPLLCPQRLFPLDQLYVLECSSCRCAPPHRPSTGQVAATAPRPLAAQPWWQAQRQRVAASKALRSGAPAAAARLLTTPRLWQGPAAATGDAVRWAEAHGGLHVKLADRHAGHRAMPATNAACHSLAPPPRSADEPPEVGSIHHARVMSVRPFGVFVELPGFRKQALVHHSQAGLWGRCAGLLQGFLHCHMDTACVQRVYGPVQHARGRQGGTAAAFGLAVIVQVSPRLCTFRPATLSLQISEDLHFGREDDDEMKIKVRCVCCAMLRVLCCVTPWSLV